MKETVLRLKFLFVLGTVSSGLSLASARCGRDYFEVSMPALLKSYRTAFTKAGFKVVKAESEEKAGRFWAKYEVPGSAFENEFRETLTVTAGGISACGVIEETRKPTQYEAAERNAYMGPFQQALKNAQAKLNNQYRKGAAELAPPPAGQKH